MADALLVFTPLQGFSFFVLRSSCDDLHRCNTSVTAPTLTVYTGSLLPRLSLWSSARLCWLAPQYASSPRLFLCAFDAAYPFRQPSPPTYKLSASAFLSGCFLLVSASCVASLRTYRLSLIFAWGLPFCLILVGVSFLIPTATKQFQPSLTFVLLDKEPGAHLSMNATPLEVFAPSLVCCQTNLGAQIRRAFLARRPAHRTKG